MNEKVLIEQVSRIINSNYSNIYVLDIPLDKVYVFAFTVTNSLIIKETMSYTDFVDMATNFVHKDELKNYFAAISLNHLEEEAAKGNSETKVRYRKLCDTGEYRWYVNIINYLPVGNSKLIFMMSEDVNERQLASEEQALQLQNEVSAYQNRINNENENISDAIYQINSLLENSMATDGVLTMRDTKEYINSIFSRISSSHPELNQALVTKMAESVNYKKPTILIVDDSSIIRNSLKRIFNSEFNILMAKDGQEAIDILTENLLQKNFLEVKNNVVGVLLDLIMPNVDGFQVLDFMHEHNLLNRVPVAIISGDETRETRKRVYNYDIVDMLEKPFNTENIRRRISKIINLYISGNRLQDIVAIQNQRIDDTSHDNYASMQAIMQQIVENILNNDESLRLKRMVRILALEVASRYPEYKLDPKRIDALVNTCALYNIGSIAMSRDMVITSQNIQKEITNGLIIAEAVLSDENDLAMAKIVIQNSLEMYDGTGYPNNIAGSLIPIEAQITNILVRLNQSSNSKNITNVIKSITDTDSLKYNPHIIEALNNVKKDLKNL